MVLEYNRKLVGKQGELYKFGDALYGVYTVSKATAKKISLVRGAVLKQKGDYETTFSVPKSELNELKHLLKIRKDATPQKD